MKKIIIIVLLISFGIFLYIKIDSERQKNFKISFFNVGQGDAVLINFDNGEKMLVDCGPNRKVLSKLGGALPFYDRTIDYLVASHPDLDHYGGCIDVLKRYYVKNIIINKDKKENDPYWIAWNNYSNKEGAEIFILDKNKKFEIGESVLEFLFSDEYKDFDSNNLSLVFRLKYRNESFLFTGDAEFKEEESLLKEYCKEKVYPCKKLQSKYLKVGHHGSDTSSSKDFLLAIEPKFAIISVGKNSFGHPSFRILKKIGRIGSKVWRTDKKDDIILEYKENRLFLGE